MKLGQREVEDRKVEMLAYELDWTMDAAGRQVLAALAEHPAQQVQHLSAADRSAALFSYKGGQVSVNEYTAHAKAAPDTRAKSASRQRVYHGDCPPLYPA